MITLLYWVIWALGLTHRKPACPSPPFLSSLQDSPRNPQTAGCCSTATRWVVAQPVASTRITAGRPRTVLIRALLRRRPSACPSPSCTGRHAAPCRPRDLWDVGLRHGALLHGALLHFDEVGSLEARVGRDVITAPGLRGRRATPETVPAALLRQEGWRWRG